MKELKKTYQPPKRVIKNLCYDISVKLHNAVAPKKLKSKKLSVGKTRQMIFYIAVCALPLLHFCIFYIGVNANSLLLAFKSYSGSTPSWVWFDNFIKVVKDFIYGETLLVAVKNSAISYLIVTGISFPLSILFGYYAFKKFLGHSVFRVILFLPVIVSSVVMVTMFLNFVETAIPYLVEKLFGKKIGGLIGNPNTAFGTLIFYAIWGSFGSSVLLMMGAMSNIEPSILEAANMDGAIGLKEFWYIVLPQIFPTISTIFILGVSGILMGRLELFTFYGDLAPNNLRTISYIIFSKTKNALLVDYPYISAMGILYTIIGLPLTLLVKKLLEKFGPTVD